MFRIFQTHSFPFRSISRVLPRGPRGVRTPIWPMSCGGRGTGVPILAISCCRSCSRSTAAYKRDVGVKIAQKSIGQTASGKCRLLANRPKENNQVPLEFGYPHHPHPSRLLIQREEASHHKRKPLEITPKNPRKLLISNREFNIQLHTALYFLTRVFFPQEFKLFLRNTISFLTPAPQDLAQSRQKQPFINNFISIPVNAYFLTLPGTHCGTTDRTPL